MYKLALINSTYLLKGLSLAALFFPHRNIKSWC